MTHVKCSTLVLLSLLLSSCGPAGSALATPTEVARVVTPTSTPRPVPIKTATLAPSAIVTPSPTLTRSLTPTLSALAVTIPAGEPIRIGSLLAESMDWGLASRRAVEVAIADAGGEILGHPIELVGLNTECRKLGADRGAARLAVTPNLVGLVGPSCSVEVEIAALRLMGSGLLLLSPSSSNPLFTLPDTRLEGFLRTYPSNIVEIEAIARFGREALGATRMAAVHYLGDAYTEDISHEVCSIFGGMGGECIAEGKLLQGTGDARSMLKRVASSSPDVLLLVLGPYEASQVLKQARETAGLETTPIIVEEFAFDPALLTQSGEAALGVYMSRLNPIVDESAVDYQMYLLHYRDHFPEGPRGAYHAFAYDAASMLLGAIRLSAVPMPDGSLIVDREAVAVRLRETSDFPGLTGELTCSPLGDCAASAHAAAVYRIDSADPTTWNPGEGLAANPIRVWPAPGP